jgi:5S rRNA maturation endonuclease (ribonuclease M5)
LKLNEVLDRLNRVKKTGENQYIACCPAHRDDKPSLSISGSNGKILLHCQAGCDTQRIVEAIGIQMKDLYIQERSGGGWELLRDHLYHDEAGSVIAKKELYLKPDGSKTGVWLRLRNGKYEKGLKGLDIPLYNLPALIGSTGAVYVAEGEKDADTLNRMGFVATTSPNGAGSKWKATYNRYFTDRDVVILTDNDEPGRLHGEEIKRALIPVAKSVKFIPATAIWPDVPPKGDISDIVAHFGIDTAREMLAAAVDVATEETRPKQEPYTQLPGGYALKGGCLYQDIAHSENSDARQELKYLLNGWVEAVGEVTHDNGIDVDRVLKLNFHCCNGKEIQAETSFKDLQNGQFLTMFGMDARPAVGTTKKAYIADSILAQSDTAIRQTIYTQTGWRKIGGSWGFLHGGGAIGAEGVTVELAGRNIQYQFPDSESPERYETLQRFFTVAPESITYPLVALAFLSPLNEAFRRAGYEPAFVMWLQGTTGAMKSTLAALTLNFFGESWNNKSLPHTFKDSANFLEKSGFLLADVLTICDDYYPATNRIEATKMAATAQSISRSWGDRTGRSRMNSDTSLRRGYPARGILLCTGEDAPLIGQSGAARSFVLELKKGDVQLSELSYLQAHTDHLAECMRDYIEWLIPQMDSLPERLKTRFYELRGAAQQEQHGRTIEAIAHLQVATETFSRFLVDRGEIDAGQAEKMQRDSWRIFNELADEQNRRISQDRPTTLFLDALKELIETKTYNIAKVDSNNPYGDYTPDRLLGFCDNEFYYLYPESAYKAVKMFYSQSERNFPLSKNQLYKHLKIEQLIEAGEQQTTKQKKIKGNNGKWLWLKRTALEISESEKPEK